MLVAIHHLCNMAASAKTGVLYHPNSTTGKNRGIIRILLIACCLPITAVYSQSDVLKYARQIVDTLASPSMHGRGYVMKGDSIAADYIKKEFEKFRLKTVGKEFEQRFYFPVNTFPGRIFCKVFPDYFERLQDAKGGVDFIVHGASSGIIGDFKTVVLDSSIVYSKKRFSNFKRTRFKNKFIILDSTNVRGKEQLEIFKNALMNPYKAKGIIIAKKDWSKVPAWEVSQFQNKFPIIEYRKLYLGNEVNTSISISIEAKFIPNCQSQNIIGYIPGTQYPDSFIVFTAHYDHLGMMGKDVCFPGANDNASGCAMLLNLAKYYSEHKPKYSVVFMAFGAEEVGLIGSKYYTAHPLFPLNKIKFLVNFDIVGTGDEGIKIVNATEHKKEFDELVKINYEKKYLPDVLPRGKAAISDHHFFEEAGVKTFYIYTLGGIKAYHDIYDRPETLPLTEFEDLYKLMIEFSEYLQK